MGTSSLYFSALTTSAKNFSGHRGLSIAVPVAAYGLSSFWEALLAGSRLFARNVVAEGGEVLKELDVVRLFYFFAILLGVVGVIGAFGLIVVPPHLPKRVEGEAASETDALLPRTEDSETSETSSVMSMGSAREELTAEHRPFLTDSSTYMFGLSLLIILGSGEMFINCVCSLQVVILVGNHAANNSTRRRFYAFPRPESACINACIIKYLVAPSIRFTLRLHGFYSSPATVLSNPPINLPRTRTRTCLISARIHPNPLATTVVLDRECSSGNQLWRNIHTSSHGS
jgi:hypothetical protein